MFSLRSISFEISISIRFVQYDYSLEMAGKVSDGIVNQALAICRYGRYKYVDIVTHIKERLHSGKSATIRESIHGLGVCKKHYM